MRLARTFAIAALPLLTFTGFAIVQAQDAAGTTEKPAEKPADPELKGVNYPALLWNFKETRIHTSKAKQAHDGDRPVFFNNPESKIEVNLKLPANRKDKPTRWGRLKLVKAVDNMGKSIAPKEENSWHSDRLQEFWGDDENDPKGSVMLTIDTDVAPRSSESIEIHATVDFEYVSDVKTKDVMGITKQKDKVVLDAAGLKVKYKGLVKQWGDAEPTFELTGKTELYQNVEVFNAAGEVVGSQGMRMEGGFGGGDGTVTIALSMDEELTDKHKIVFTYAEKVEVETAAFRLKDVKLP